MTPKARGWLLWFAVNVAVYVVTGSALLAFLAGVYTSWLVSQDLDRGHTL